jgi:hypothetical protein
LKQTAGAASAAVIAGPLGYELTEAQEATGKKLPIAAVITEYRNNSHADVIIGKVLEGNEQDGGPGPDLYVAGMYADQFPENDMARDLSKKHGFPIFDTIEESITLGTGKVAVAGVLNIGEHGRYPFTPDTRQHMYPRRRLFDEVVATFRKYDQVVPLFSDKHLAYNWADAKHMYDTAREMQIPFMAGSSLPVAWRTPPVTLPMGCEIEEALAIGYGGLEAYGFHALETLQCMVERRKGGETGVKSVETVQGEGIWQAEKEGRWSRELLMAALAKVPGVRPGKIEENLQDDGAFYLIEYRDGLKATVAMVDGVSAQFGFAGRLKGQSDPVATWFNLQDGKPYGHFAYLVKAIEHMVKTGQPAYPVERTLLTTGVLDMAMHSLVEDHRRIETPFLEIAYEPVEWDFAPGLPGPTRGA